MKVHPTDLPDVKLIEVKCFGDERGFFSETYQKDRYRQHGIGLEFVQDNHSFSSAKGTLRGLHYQIHPHAQAKLIRVSRGAILDVAVDLRRDSPTFGRHVSAVISAEQWNQLFVPVGFAHGFCTLEPDTEVLYKASSGYAPDLERGLLWNDPALGIDWPVSAEQVILSDRDRTHPPLSELRDLF